VTEYTLDLMFFKIKFINVEHELPAYVLFMIKSFGCAVAFYLGWRIRKFE